MSGGGSAGMALPEFVGAVFDGDDITGFLERLGPVFVMTKARDDQYKLDVMGCLVTSGVRRRLMEWRATNAQGTYSAAVAYLRGLYGALDRHVSIADINALVQRGAYTSLRAYLDEFEDLAAGLPEVARMEVGTKVRKFYAGLTVADQERLGLYMLDDVGRLRDDWGLLTSAVTREIGRQATIKEAAATRGNAATPVGQVGVAAVSASASATAPATPPALSAATSAPPRAAPASAAPRRFPRPTDGDLEDMMHRLRASEHAAVGVPRPVPPAQPWVGPAAMAPAPTIMSVPAPPAYRRYQ
ncbi:hypothetical protein HK101_007098 [Irineochytrium annulatum]|nr:hypothetical protein HK101_007098 [Irineochytrium annulatum]